MELYWNEDRTEYAVLVSPGYGAGWSTWNQRDLAYDKRVIEYFLMNHSKAPEDVAAAMERFGYEGVYCGGWHKVRLEWVKKDAVWTMREYDGAEHIEYYNPDNWNCFSNA